jgi:hypothetical protein
LSFSTAAAADINKVKLFFLAVEKDAITLGKDAKSILTKLFGAQAVASLESAAEAILQSDFGQAVLAEGEKLLALVVGGSISQASAITELATTTLSAAKNAGIQMEQSIATGVASLALAKLQGVIGTPATPTPAAPAPPAST